ncbi:hypothetical protein DFQ29_001614, partial [Apophysomyces sp. BC1021]
MHLVDFVLNTLPDSTRKFDDNAAHIWRQLLFVLREIDKCTQTSPFTAEPPEGSILSDI